MPNQIMIEVEQWLDNLCRDAEKEGIDYEAMLWLLLEKSLDYTLKIIAQSALKGTNDR